MNETGQINKTKKKLINLKNNATKAIDEEFVGMNDRLVKALIELKDL